MPRSSRWQVAIMMIVVACSMFVIEAAEIAAPFLCSIEAPDG